MAQWKALGALGFSSGASGDQNIAFHLTTHEPYVAFKEATSGKITVMKYDGAAWVLVGAAGFSAGSADFISLAFNPATDEPYVVFKDGSLGDKTTVMKYDGASWSVVGAAGFSMGVGFFHSLAFHPFSFEPYVAFQDMGTGGMGVLMSFDGASWGMVGGVPFSPGGAFNMTLVFHPGAGDPLVGFEDDSVAGKASVVIFDTATGTWGSLGPAGFSSGISTGHSLAIDDVGDIYLAYTDLPTGSKLTVMKFDTGSFSWLPVGSVGFTPGAVSFPSLAFKPGTSMPYVAFVDAAAGDHASVMSFDGTSWTMFGTSGFSPDLASFMDFAFHPMTGDPYVAFTDASTSGKSSVMWFDPAVLPVELSKFEANWKNNAVQLIWETASEKDNNFFIIERSFDGRGFVDIAKINGSNDNSFTTQYQYLDQLEKERISTAEKIYYRLKQVDLDGSFSYSDIVQVDYLKVKISISPNPTLGQVKLSFDKEVTVQITVFDNSAKVVFQKRGKGKQLDFDLSFLPEGLYSVAIESAAGIISQSQILIFRNGK